mgnify:FL=1
MVNTNRKITKKRNRRKRKDKHKTKCKSKSKSKKNTKVPYRYLPNSITKKDKKRYSREIRKSRKLYKCGVYYKRKKIKSYTTRKSSHVSRAKDMYKIDSIKPSRELAKKTGCSLKALNEIDRKGRGAMFASGSRPNQTASSWSIARVASAITGGKSAAVDYHILEKGCKPGSKALRLAKKSRRKHGYGKKHSKLAKLF